MAPPPQLAEAVRLFLRANAAIESSAALEMCLEEVAAAEDSLVLFTAPLRHKLLGYDGAMRWLHFVQLAVPALYERADEGTAPAFDPAAALSVVTEVYDLKTDEVVWTHVLSTLDNSDSDSDDDDSDGDSDSDSDGAAGPADEPA